MQNDHSWASEPSLEERVLLYLRRQGPKEWVAVYLHFDHGATGEIGQVLKTLASLEQIEPEKLGYIQISLAGLERLSNGGAGLNGDYPSTAAFKPSANISSI
jgi:hypothetical protein